MLKVFQVVVDFLAVDLSVYAPYILIGLAVSFVVIFILEAVLANVKGAEYSTVYYQSYLLLNLVAITYFAVEDLLGLGVIFKTAKSIYAFISVLAILSILFFVVVKIISTTAKTQKVKIAKTLNVEEEVLPPSRIAEYFNTGGAFTGYLDVNYTKSLIRNLKTKNLTESDFQKIEELELYLLRFTSRQPTPDERAELSEKLSMLMKKLAEYAS